MNKLNNYLQKSKVIFIKIDQLMILVPSEKQNSKSGQTFRNIYVVEIETVVQRCSVKNVFLKISQNSQQNTCARVSFLIKLRACNFIKKETLAQVFSSEF